jgi:hypothetical protein
MESYDKTIGKYGIGRTLGDGGSCKVKMGYDTSNGNKKVAIKIMNDVLSAEIKALMKNEIEAMLMLKGQNEHIIDIIEQGT